ncbi:PAS fold family [Planoprotostelium fungivorum]|uniref:PAS fold family n=1 Tax=Planoprotostelium fungivorum TaxID=1890364 RepID=A0A2P6NXD9_9EUKA|nr:PAS fold family [Planoprotostelium fungivorum]
MDSNLDSPGMGTVHIEEEYQSSTKDSDSSETSYWKNGVFRQIWIELQSRFFLLTVLISSFGIGLLFLGFAIGPTFFDYVLSTTTIILCFLMFTAFCFGESSAKGFFLTVGFGYLFVGINLIFGSAARNGALTGTGDSNIVVQFNICGRTFEVVSIFIGLIIANIRVRGWIPKVLTVVICIASQILMVSGIMRWKTFVRLVDETGEDTYPRTILENLFIGFFACLLILVIFRRPAFRPNVWVNLTLGLAFRLAQTIMAANIANFNGGPSYTVATTLRCFSFAFLFSSLGVATLRNPIKTMHHDTQKKTAALHIHQDMISWMIEQFPSIVVLLDNRGEICHLNRYAVKSLGLRSMRMSSTHFLRCFTFTDSEVCQMQLDELILSGDPNTQLSFRSFDGESRSIEWTIKVLRTDNEHLPELLAEEELKTFEESVQILCLGKDVTDKVTREMALVGAREEAIRLAHMKDTFVANISHELRTPLNCIIGVSDLVQQGENTSDVLQGMFVIIRTAANTLLGLINDLLDFAKLTQGQLKIVCQTLLLREFVENSCMALSVLFRDSDLGFGYRISSECPEYIVNDENRLRQILHNLLTNAIKYTNKGRVTLQVMMNQEKENEGQKTVAPSLRFIVTDSGQGIHPIELEALHERLFQGGQGNLKLGSGIGLNIVKQLLLLMGGDLMITSRHKEWTRAEFIVPVIMSSSNSDSSLTRSRAESMKNHSDSTSSMRDLNGKRSRRELVSLQSHKPLICVFLVDTYLTDLLVQSLSIDLGIETFGFHTVDDTNFFLRDTAPSKMAGTKTVWKRQLSIVVSQENAEKLDAEAMRRMNVESIVQIIIATSVTTDIDRKGCSIHEPIQLSILVRLLSRTRQRAATKSSENPPLPMINTLPLDEPPVVDVQTVHLNVLIVEDNKTNQRLMLDRLKNISYDFADDGSIAVQKFLEKAPERYDCILMDQQMPVLNGIEATEQIRSIETKRQLERTHIAALTANAQKEEEDKCYEAGMDDYITKPIGFRNHCWIARNTGSPSNYL